MSRKTWLLFLDFVRVKTGRSVALALALTALWSSTAGCRKSESGAAPTSTPSGAPQKHAHHAPHGGTPVVLGAELYHIELVRDGANGLLQAYVLDGEMENFIRLAQLSLTIDVTVNGAMHPLVLNAVANSATGETAGDTALFEGRAEWLKSVEVFDGVVKRITIRGTEFANVGFNFPKGNDRD